MHKSTLAIQTTFLSLTSGYSSRLRHSVTPCYSSCCGARKKSTRSRNLRWVPYRKAWFIKFASALPTRPPAHCARCLCHPRDVCQPHDFLEIGNFAPFSEFLHIKGRHFPDFFPLKSTYEPYEPWKVSWKSVPTFFPKFGTQIHKQTDAAALYIYRNSSS